MKTAHSVWLFQNWASFQRDVEFAFFGHVYSTFEICVSIRFCWRNLFLSALCVVMVALDTNLFVSFARPWGGSKPTFLVKRTNIPTFRHNERFGYQRVFAHRNADLSRMLLRD